MKYLKLYENNSIGEYFINCDNISAIDLRNICNKILEFYPNISKNSAIEQIAKKFDNAENAAMNHHFITLKIESEYIKFTVKSRSEGKLVINYLDFLNMSLDDVNAYLNADKFGFFGLNESLYQHLDKMRNDLITYIEIHGEKNPVVSTLIQLLSYKLNDITLNFDNETWKIKWINYYSDRNKINIGVISETTERIISLEFFEDEDLEYILKQLEIKYPGTLNADKFGFFGIVKENLENNLELLSTFLNMYQKNNKIVFDKPIFISAGPSNFSFNIISIKNLNRFNPEFNVFDASLNCVVNKMGKEIIEDVHVNQLGTEVLTKILTKIKKLYPEFMDADKFGFFGLKENFKVVNNKNMKEWDGYTIKRKNLKKQIEKRFNELVIYSTEPIIEIKDANLKIDSPRYRWDDYTLYSIEKRNNIFYIHYYNNKKLKYFTLLEDMIEIKLLNGIKKYLYKLTPDDIKMRSAIKNADKFGFFGLK